MLVKIHDSIFLFKNTENSAMESRKNIVGSSIIPFGAKPTVE
nr:MAG TPA: hypothetical protein [Caudoviricetes sp.]